MADAEVNGVRLHYELKGAGDAGVFVHGALLDHHDWDVVAAQIAQSFQVLSYDRRGHSQSSGNGSLDDDLADVAALIEYLQLAPVHLVGNSLGGCNRTATGAGAAGVAAQRQRPRTTATSPARSRPRDSTCSRTGPASRPGRAGRLDYRPA
jgi:pimeloyl-ACP methyl ester carboxylesterase